MLAVDTSSAGGSLALLRGGETIGKAALDQGLPHSRILFQQLDELCRSAGMPLSQIDLFVVVTGPGSFTGLRVGMAAMLGVARAEQKTLIGVTAFDAWAKASGSNGEVTVLIEAGRNQVYCGNRLVSSEGRVTIEKPDEMVDRRGLDLVLSNGGCRTPRLIVGEVGAEDAERLRIDGYRLWVGKADLAEAAGRLGWRRWQDGEVAPAVPYYIRAADAEDKARAGK